LVSQFFGWLRQRAHDLFLRFPPRFSGNIEGKRKAIGSIKGLLRAEEGYFHFDLNK
jgi:hypothetical protein